MLSNSEWWKFQLTRKLCNFKNIWELFCRFFKKFTHELLIIVYGARNIDAIRLWLRSWLVGVWCITLRTCEWFFPVSKFQCKQSWTAKVFFSIILLSWVEWTLVFLFVVKFVRSDMPGILGANGEYFYENHKANSYFVN